MRQKKGESGKGDRFWGEMRRQRTEDIRKDVKLKERDN